MNGNNALSYSELDDLSRCAKLYQIRYGLGLQPKRKNINLRLGTEVHGGLQAENLGRLEGESGMYGLYFTTRITEVRESPDLFEDEKEEDVKLLEDAERIVQNYLAFYGTELEREEILHVEETFVSVLDTGHVVSSTPDLVYRRSDGSVMVRDYKTTTQTPSYTTPSSNLQVITNFASVQAVYPEAIGFEFDRLRKKVPTEPRLAKTGKRRVANLSQIDTTFETLRDFLTHEAPDLLDDPDHRMRLAELRDTNRFFYREQVFPTPEHIANGLEDVAALADLREHYIRTGRWPRSYLSSGMRSCDTCPVRSICHGELLGWDVEAIIADGYEPRDTSHREYETVDL